MTPKTRASEDRSEERARTGANASRGKGKATHQQHGGLLLRQWRQRRRRSQLDLALDTGISARHLSFVETGRSRPSRGLLLALAEQLDVPLRERNALMLAAGYAPTYAESDLDSTESQHARDALERCSPATSPTLPSYWTAGATSC